MMWFKPAVTWLPDSFCVSLLVHVFLEILRELVQPIERLRKLAASGTGEIWASEPSRVR